MDSAFPVVIYYKFSSVSISYLAVRPALCKKVKIQSFYWSSFSRIQFKYRKMRARKDSVFAHFSNSAAEWKLACITFPKRRWCNCVTVCIIKKRLFKKLSKCLVWLSNYWISIEDRKNCKHLHAKGLRVIFLHSLLQP